MTFESMNNFKKEKCEKCKGRGYVLVMGCISPKESECKECDGDGYKIKHTSKNLRDIKK